MDNEYFEDLFETDPIIHENFRFERIMGKGAFGIVVDAVNKEGNNVAMKAIINLDKLIKFILDH